MSRLADAESKLAAALDALETCDGSLPLPLADGFEESVADDGAARRPRRVDHARSIRPPSDEL